MTKRKEYVDEDYQYEESDESMDDSEETDNREENEEKKRIYREYIKRVQNENEALQKVKDDARKLVKYDGNLTCMVLSENKVERIHKRLSDGHATSNVNIKKPCLSVSRLVWFCLRKRVSDKLTVSHLCKDRNCFNPWHLHAESKTNSNIRTGCPGYYRCPGSSELWIACKHNPKCIKITDLVECDEGLDEKYEKIDLSEIDPTPKKKSKIWAKKNTR